MGFKNLKTTAQHIFLLMEKTHARMGIYGELKQDFLGAIFEALNTYELDTLKKAMREFEQMPSSKMRSFPRLGDIIEKVKQIDDGKKEEIRSLKYKCEYSDVKEAEYSNSLCQKEISWHEMNESKNNIGFVYCMHHQKRFDAIRNPHLERSIKFISDMREGEKIRLKSKKMPVGFDDFASKLEWVEFHKKYVIDEIPIKNFFEDVENGRFQSLKRKVSQSDSYDASVINTEDRGDVKNDSPCDPLYVRNNPVKSLFC